MIDHLLTDVSAFMLLICDLKMIFDNNNMGRLLDNVVMPMFLIV